MTTFVLSMYNANLIHLGGKAVVLSLALAYGGIAQLLAGMCILMLDHLPLAYTGGLRLLGG
jgi:succinate-acetate transporter protein